MKYLVLGASGMAGHTISLYLKEAGHDVTGFSRKPISFVKNITGDVRDFEKVKQIIRIGMYDAVINCIGILNKAAEDNKAEAVLLNSYLPHFLVQITESMKTQIVHMSTDCVFSGEKGNYKEHDFCDGLSFYDRSKALGELNDKKNITLRNSIVGPDMHEQGIGLFNWFMLQEKGSTIHGYTKAMWTGLTTLELAKVIEKATVQKCTGLINMVYKKNISKYELLCLFNNYMRNNCINILPESSLVLDKTLIRTNFSLNYEVSDYESMIEDMAKWIKKHDCLYKHYFNEK